MNEQREYLNLMTGEITTAKHRSVKRPRREVQQLTLEQIRALPNMLGILAASEVQRHGFYNCVIGGKPVRIEVQR